MPCQRNASRRTSARRQFLMQSGVGLLGAALGCGRAASAGEANSPPPAAADRVILVLLTGGPSHLDMWDPKPDAPAEIRGPFQSIATAVPDVRVSEHLPQLARAMSRCALVRSVHHTARNHPVAAYVALTGVDDGGKDRPVSQTDHPAVGSVLSQRLKGQGFPLPYVWLPFHTSVLAIDGRQPIRGILGGFLGPRYDPFFVLDDPSDPDFSVPALRLPEEVSPDRMQGRRNLLERLASRERIERAVSLRVFQEQAFDLLTSADLAECFSLEREPRALREAYGENRFGASLLLARRLVEAGSRCVCVSFGEDLNNTWDTHSNNFTLLERALLPKFDAGFSTLLADLEDRGMLERTLVVALGEFGREPKIGEDAGRNHWPDCYTVLLAGGGIRGGVVHGASDRQGAFPDRDPVSPADVLATAYACLGLPHDEDDHLIDALGRPIHFAPGGTPIRSMLT